MTMTSTSRGHCTDTITVDGVRLVCTGLGHHPGYCHAYDERGNRYEYGTK